MKYAVTIAGRTFDVEVDGEQVTVGGRTYALRGEPLPGTPLWRFEGDGAVTSLPLEAIRRGWWRLTVHGERLEAEAVDERTRHIRSLTSATGASRGAGALAAPMPGLVTRVLVEPGQAVAAGEGVIVLEAMKMENELKAPAAGVVREVAVRAGQAVEKGQALVTFEA